MTWAQAILIFVLAFSTFTISGAIRFAAERVSTSIDGNSMTLGIQNLLYMTGMDDEHRERAQKEVDEQFFPLVCDNPNCSVHGERSSA